MTTRILLVLAALSAGCTPSEAAQAPCGDCSIVWITVDTLRADRVGANGNRDGLTPGIDALAARGTTVTHALAPGPLTILSVPAYLSARHRFNTGMGFSYQDSLYEALPDEVVTLPEALKAAGFRTGAFLSNPVLGYTKGKTGTRADSDPFALSGGFDTWYYYNDDANIEAAATRWLAEPTPGRRFLYLHLMGPHDPNAEVPGFAERHGAIQSRYAAAKEVTFGDYLEVRQARHAPSKADVAYVAALYDEAVREVDTSVARVLDAVAAAPGGERTLVVITSDHGEALGEPYDGHAWFGHGHNLRDELLRVPLVLAGPGVPAGLVDPTSVVELIDLAPTLLDLAGVARPAEWGWDGEAFLGPRAKPASYALSERDDGEVTTGVASDGRYRVFLPKAGGPAQRYDLLADPLQRKPIAPNPTTEALITARKQAWAQAHPPTAAPFVPDDGTLEKLRAMGYVE